MSHFSLIRSTPSPRALRFSILFCFLELKDKQQLLVGVCYRSPNSSEENNKRLLQIINNIAAIQVTHVLIMGDFNFPQIDYERYCVDDREDSPAQNFSTQLKICF